jgi:hypothetical protein
MRSLESALKAKGAIFGADGSVGVRMKWIQVRPSSKRIREGTLAILNSARKAKGMAPLIDCEDGQ